MKTGEKLSLCLLLLIVFAGSVAAQELITNVYGRNIHSLNGKWNAIIDLYDQGQRMKIYENRQPEGNIDFYEYAFEGGLRLNVPGDWNSQSPELKYYEGTVWYARHFDAKRLADKRQFLYFGAVSYRCKVYLNGKEIAEHEGGFTPFQVEVTDLLKDGDNFLAVEVNNRRTKDAIPAMAFDWWNYGGITRDVLLVKTPRTFIEDYFIQLDKNAPDRIIARVRLSDKKAGEKVTVAIPELKINAELTTDAEGKVLDGSPFATDEDGFILTGNLLPGTYTVEELLPEDSLYECKSENPQTVTVKQGEIAEVSFINALRTGKVTVEKIDITGSPLAGATFRLEWSAEGSLWYPVTYSESIVRGGCSNPDVTDGSLTTGADGILEWDNLYPGLQYRLTETKAPDGYNLLDGTAFERELAADNMTVSLRVVNTRTYTLPKTGSSGLRLFPVFALIPAFTCSSALVFSILRKRRS